MLKEILAEFIPQTKIQSKNRTYLRWEKGREYVEVWVPGFKIGKLKSSEKRPWIVASFVSPYKLKNGRVVYKNYTSSYEYNETQLTLLLNELAHRFTTI